MFLSVRAIAHEKVLLREEQDLSDKDRARREDAPGDRPSQASTPCEDFDSPQSLKNLGHAAESASPLSQRLDLVRNLSPVLYRVEKLVPGINSVSRMNVIDWDEVEESGTGDGVPYLSARQQRCERNRVFVVSTKYLDCLKPGHSVEPIFSPMLMRALDLPQPVSGVDIRLIVDPLVILRAQKDEIRVGVDSVPRTNITSGPHLALRDDVCFYAEHEPTQMRRLGLRCERALAHRTPIVGSSPEEFSVCVAYRHCYSSTAPKSSVAAVLTGAAVRPESSSSDQDVAMPLKEMASFVQPFFSATWNSR